MDVAVHGGRSFQEPFQGGGGGPAEIGRMSEGFVKVIGLFPYQEHLLPHDSFSRL